MTRQRKNVLLDARDARALTEMSRMRGVSQSALIAAALASFLSPDGADRREAALIKRLDRLSHQFERLERDQTILIETLALFIRYFLSISTPLAESQQDAARAAGLARFESFVEQLAGHLQRGHSLVRDLHEQFVPEAHEFSSLHSTRAPAGQDDAP